MPKTGICGHGLRAEDAFPPNDPARHSLLEQIHQIPEPEPEGSTRWTLALMQRRCPPLSGLRTLSGVWRRLKKWEIAQKQGRLHISSPDPHYTSKLSAIAAAWHAAEREPERVSLLYADELTVYRQPPLGRVWHQRGPCEPTAPFVGRANTKARIGAALEARTGQVFWVMASTIGVAGICRLLIALRTRLGPERRVYLVWDNWPIHRHEQVLTVAQAQQIDLLYLPTYAPWTNPIEKLWRKLKQSVLRMHRLSQEWEQLKCQIQQFLADHDQPRPDLLHYVGLLPQLLPH